jgi:hypothetical protein
MKMACQAVVLERPGNQGLHIQSACAPLRHDSSESFRGWARQDSNLGPRDYESPALTAELQARMIVEVKHSKPLVTNPESIYAAVRWWIEQLHWRAVAE